MFKKGIRPEWEDPMNRTGAEFTCRKTMQPEVLDGYWENLVLGLIGETIDADHLGVKFLALEVWHPGPGCGGLQKLLSAHSTVFLTSLPPPLSSLAINPPEPPCHPGGPM